MKKLLPRVIMSIFMCYLLLPLVMTVAYSFSTEWYKTILPPSYTLKWYGELFGDGRFWLAVGRTLLVSIVPIFLNLLFMLLTMFVVVVYLPKYERILQGIVFLPYAIPSVVLSIVFLRMFSSTFGPSVVLLVIAFSVLILPQMYQGIRNSMRTINIKEMVDAATMLGASRFNAFCFVIIPNILPGIQVSVLLSFSILFGEFALTQVLLGGYYETVQIMLFNYLKISSHTASAIVVSYFVIILVTTYLALKLSKGKLNNQFPN
jgi:putative spermidine/putrescine transport system permease protein